MQGTTQVLTDGTELGRLRFVVDPLGNWCVTRDGGRPELLREIRERRESHHCSGVREAGGTPWVA